MALASDSNNNSSQTKEHLLRCSTCGCYPESGTTCYVLSCFHAICHKCLRKCIVERSKATCTACGYETEADNIGRHLINWMNKYSTAAVMPREYPFEMPPPPQPEKDPQQMQESIMFKVLCPSHRKCLDAFCLNCQLLVCIKCISTQHKHHEWCLTDDAIVTQREVIAEQFRRWKQKLDNETERVEQRDEGTRDHLQTALKAVEKIQQKLDDAKTQAIKQITKMLESKADDLLKSSTKSIRDEVSTVYPQIDVLDKQRKVLKQMTATVSVLKDENPLVIAYYNRLIHDNYSRVFPADAKGPQFKDFSIDLTETLSEDFVDKITKSVALALYSKPIIPSTQNQIFHQQPEPVEAPIIAPSPLKWIEHDLPLPPSVVQSFLSPRSSTSSDDRSLSLSTSSDRPPRDPTAAEIQICLAKSPESSSARRLSFSRTFCIRASPVDLVEIKKEKPVCGGVLTSSV